MSVPCENGPCQIKRDPDCELCGGLYHHECRCDRHHCGNDVSCEKDGCEKARYPHICEECESDPSCNGEDMNPSEAWAERSILSGKL